MRCFRWIIKLNTILTVLVFDVLRSNLLRCTSGRYLPRYILCHPRTKSRRIQRQNPLTCLGCRLTKEHTSIYINLKNITHLSSRVNITIINSGAISCKTFYLSIRSGLSQLRQCRTVADNVLLMNADKSTLI